MEDNSMCKNVKLGATAPTAAMTITSDPSQNCAVGAAEALIATATINTTTTPNGKGKQLAAVAAEEPTELLGSVTTHNCPGTRASARVIQKMKQDLTRPMTPPPNEREHGKKEEKTAQKTPSQMRAANKTTWTNLERNYFFDALNEYGKDFEAVANCINAKLKRRNAASDYSFKSKDQVRQHYYQTYHKIGKYVRYSDELKKPAQELYTLINYGELRRKLQFLTEKHFMKLKQLVYQGIITVRCKGKNIRIKTPSCKALRRLNQLDDSLEDIRLPSKIEVLVSPANMEAFGRVQSLAQNPRGRAIVPLHKKLVTFIKTFQYKWRSADARLAEEKLPPPSSVEAEANLAAATAATASTTLPELCFLPKPGVTIHRPLLSITAYLNSVNICLTAYEERLGVKVRSETLTSVANSKRPRTESGSEKRSPETKKPKPLSSPAHEKSLEDLTLIKDETSETGADTANISAVASSTTVKLENSSGDELSEEIREEFISVVPAGSETAETTKTTETTVSVSAAIGATAAPTVAPLTQSRPGKRSDAGGGGVKGAKARPQAQNFRPLLSDDVLKRIRKGWTVVNAADITIGDLYVVLGQDSKLELEYFWCDLLPAAATAGATALNQTQTTTAASNMPYNSHDCDSVERVKAVSTATVSNKLKHLLLIANLSERVRKQKCSCGHTCDRIMAAKCRRDLVNRAQWAQLAAGAVGDRGLGLMAAMDGNFSGDSSSVFRTPMLPLRRPICSIDPVRQLSTLTRQKMSRQVLVQRRILPPASSSSSAAAAQPYDLLDVRNLQNGLFEPIERANGSHQPLLPSQSSMSSKSVSTETAAGNSFSSSEDTMTQLELEYNSSSSGYGSAAAVNMDMPTLDFCMGSTASPATYITLPEGAQDESTTHNFFNGSVSPMHLLRDSTSNARWLEENINDFSLTSLLGHLDEIDASRDILDPSSTMSVISESSVDFRHKFQEIAALLQSQEKD